MNDLAVPTTPLGIYLKDRRARLDPAAFGFSSGRRRTPGLRREEVAQLAGVGVTWYTWLEQGRDIHPSPQVLDAIARTLLFDPHERAHLFTLAGTPDTTIAGECQVLSPTVQVLLDQLEPYPALAVNARYDLLAYNRIWLSSVPHVESIPLEDRNALWLIFTDPKWQKMVLDREETTSWMVGQYRAAMAEHVAEPAWKGLGKRLLKASPEFAAVWERHDVLFPESRVKRIRHPIVGELRLDSTYLWLAQRLGTRIVCYTPADAQTARRLEKLHLTLEAEAAA